MGRAFERSDSSICAFIDLTTRKAQRFVSKYVLQHGTKLLDTRPKRKSDEPLHILPDPISPLEKETIRS